MNLAINAEMLSPSWSSMAGGAAPEPQTPLKCFREIYLQGKVHPGEEHAPGSQSSARPRFWPIQGSRSTSLRHSRICDPQFSGVPGLAICNARPFPGLNFPPCLSCFLSLRGNYP